MGSMIRFKAQCCGLYIRCIKFGDQAFGGVVDDADDTGVDIR